MPDLTIMSAPNASMVVSGQFDDLATTASSRPAPETGTRSSRAPKTRSRLPNRLTHRAPSPVLGPIARARVAMDVTQCPECGGRMLQPELEYAA